MLIQAVGIPVFQLDGAFASPGGLRLLHPWNTKSRALGHAAAEAVPESRQHSSRCCRYLGLFFTLSFSLSVFFIVLSLSLCYSLLLFRFRDKSTYVKGTSRAADSRRQTSVSCLAARHHRENDDYRESRGRKPAHISISHRLS